MDHVRLEGQDEAVRRFVLSLDLNSGGTVLELDGEPVACVLPVAGRNGAMPSEWTDAKNDRRCALIDRKYAGMLSAEETVELHTLHSAYRELTRPVLRYLDELDSESPDDIITVIIFIRLLYRWWCTHFSFTSSLFM